LDLEFGLIEGHVFAECYIKDKWYQIDPEMGTIYTRKNYSSFEIYDKGLDSWDIGIKSREDVREKFEEYKRSYAG